MTFPTSKSFHFAHEFCEGIYNVQKLLKGTPVCPQIVGPELESWQFRGGEKEDYSESTHQGMPIVGRLVLTFQGSINAMYSKSAVFLFDTIKP